MSHRADPVDSAQARPLRADAERNRLRLIAVAEDVFAERGLKVTLDDISRRAGVGVGTAYRRFADIEELVDAVFDEQVKQMVSVAEDALDHEDPWEGLVYLLHTTVRKFDDNRGLRDVVLNRAHGRNRVAAMRERLTPVVAAAIARAQQAGALREDIEVTDVPLIQLMLGAVSQQGGQSAPELWTRYLTLILDGLRPNRLQPTPLSRPALSQSEFDQVMT